MPPPQPATQMFMPRRSNNWSVFAVVAGIAILVSVGVVALLATSHTPSPDVRSQPQAGIPWEQVVDEEPAAEVPASDIPDLPNFSAWTLEIPTRWLDVSRIDYPSLARDSQSAFVGSWNIDGLANDSTSSFMYVYQLADYFLAEEVLTEVASANWSWFFDDVVVESSETIHRTTTAGHELLIQTAQGDCQGYACSRVMLLVRDGADLLVVFYYGPRDAALHVHELTATIDSVRRTEA